MSPIETSEGKMALASVVDISGRKWAEAQRELLLADLNHLVVRGVPVVFATGYGKVAGTARGHAEAIDKPYTQDRLASALWRAMAAPQAAGSNA